LYYNFLLFFNSDIFSLPNDRFVVYTIDIIFGKEIDVSNF